MNRFGKEKSVEKKSVIENRSMRIKQIIENLNIQGVWYAQLRVIDQRFEEAPDNDELPLEISRSFSRLALNMAYEIEKNGDTVIRKDLDLLMMEIEKIYGEDGKFNKNSEEAIERESLIDTSLLEIKFFRKDDKISIDYAEKTALESATEAIDEKTATTNIALIVEQTRLSAEAAMISENDTQKLGKRILDVLCEYENLREILNDEENFYADIQKRIQMVCDELFLSSENILENEKTIRIIVPERLAEFAPLLDKHIEYIWGWLREERSLFLKPDLKSIWNALISNFLDDVREDLNSESEQDEEEEENSIMILRSAPAKDFGAN